MLIIIIAILEEVLGAKNMTSNTHEKDRMVLEAVKNSNLGKGDKEYIILTFRVCNKLEDFLNEKKIELQNTQNRIKRGVEI